jgi:hypothetical protein
MRNSGKLFVGLIVAGSTLVASAQTGRDFERRTTGATKAKMEKGANGDDRIVRFGNLRTGELYDTSAVSVRDHLEYGFNSFNGSYDGLPDYGFAGGENLNYSWIGPAPDYVTICDFNDPNLFTYLYIQPMSASTCGDPNDAGNVQFAFGVTCSAWHIIFDNYFCDPALWNGDPNSTRGIDQVTVIVRSVDHGGDLTRIIFGFFERFDRNGDGNFCATDGGPYYVDANLNGAPSSGCSTLI